MPCDFGWGGGCGLYFPRATVVLINNNLYLKNLGRVDKMWWSEREGGGDRVNVPCWAGPVVPPPTTAVLFRYDPLRRSPVPEVICV